jgi:hypothetical protein
MKKYFFFIISLSLFLELRGQDSEWLLRKKVFVATTRIIKIDTFSIQPSFFVLKDSVGKTVPKTEYEIDFPNALLKWKNLNPYINQKFTVYYFTFPSTLKKTIFTYTKPSAETSDTLLLPLTIPPPKKDKEPFHGLKTSGQITRGVTAGNNQSLVMQSGMELHIEGNLNSTIKLKAVIADDNMPQAYAGISKSYKDYKYIYMQLTGTNWKAKGGDFMHEQHESYFLKSKRKIQGLQFETGKKTNVSITGGIIDGDFVRQQFHGIDGNQGPYLLKGKHGEKYIFVIKDSEKVYINGQPLKNGKDYEMDYELAQLIFKPTLPINSNDRITVEFNYSNQYYLKYLNHNKMILPSKNGKLEIYTYLEKDNKLHSLLFDMDQSAVEKLRIAGDNPQELWIESAKKTTYNQNKILYKKVITATGYYYEFTTEELPELYEVRFSYVGKNQGSYNIEKVTAIGKIYHFQGDKQGDYDPIIYLVPPTTNQYAGLKWSHKTTTNGIINTDFILSYTDKNLFSKLNDDDNTGGAINLEYIQTIHEDSIKKWDVSGKYRFTHQNFAPLDPYTDPEFLYQWQIDSLYGQQHFIQASSLYSGKNSLISTGMEYLDLNHRLNAVKGFVTGNSHMRNIYWKGENTYVYQNQNQGHLNKTKLDNELGWIFQSGTWSHHFYIEERRKEKNNIKDSMDFGYYFYETKWKKTNSGKEFEIGLRIEQNDSLVNQAYEKTRTNRMIYLQKKHAYKNGNISFYTRWQEIHSSKEKKKTYYNISFQWKQNWVKKQLESYFKIESFNGNILRDEILFVETPTGQGQYQWVDYNQNGIKEINEFEIAVFSDQAKYIKVILPSKNLLPVKNNTYSGKLIFRPGHHQRISFWKTFYNKIIWENNFQTPLQNNTRIFVWNPSQTFIKNKKLQNDFYINRTKKKYHFHFLYQNTENEQWLIIGKQGIKNERFVFENLHQFNSQLIWKQSFSQSVVQQFSENYSDKNFELKQWEIMEDFSLFRKNNFQWSFFFVHKNKKSLSGEEKLNMDVLGTKFILFPRKKYSLYTQIKYIGNDFEGNPYSPIAFYMLEALQNGQNFLGEINYKQKINKSMEMNLNYRYRKSENHTGIHTGGIQFRMSF